MPQWNEDDYFQAIRELAAIGATEVVQAEATEDVRAILSIIAIEKGLRAHSEASSCSSPAILLNRPR